MVSKHVGKFLVSVSIYCVAVSVVYSQSVSQSVLRPPLSVFEGEVSGVEAGPGKSSKHLRAVSGTWSEQSLHAGGDVIQVRTPRLRGGQKHSQKSKHGSV